jgi:hypothetical protein
VVKAFFVFGPARWAGNVIDGGLIMTNFVENELYVEGSKEDLEKFKKDAAGENGCLDMKSFIPYPVQFSKQDEIHRLWIDDAIRKAESLGEVFSDDQKLDFFFRRRFHSEEAPPDGFNSGGKEWCCENWETKWNFCRSTLVFEEDDFLVYEFQTACNPPMPIILKMGERFPMLCFELRYFEGAIEVNGILEIEEGQVVRDEHGPYFGHRGI